MPATRCCDDSSASPSRCESPSSASPPPLSPCCSSTCRYTSQRQQQRVLPPWSKQAPSGGGVSARAWSRSNAGGRALHRKGSTIGAAPLARTPQRPARKSVGGEHRVGGSGRNLDERKLKAGHAALDGPRVRPRGSRQHAPRRFGASRRLECCLVRAARSCLLPHLFGQRLLCGLLPTPR